MFFSSSLFIVAFHARVPFFSCYLAFFRSLMKYTFANNGSGSLKVYQRCEWRQRRGVWIRVEGRSGTVIREKQVNNGCLIYRLLSQIGEGSEKAQNVPLSKPSPFSRFHSNQFRLIRGICNILCAPLNGELLFGFCGVQMRFLDFI